MENQTTFRSAALRRLDANIASMETDIDLLLAENTELKEQVRQLEWESFRKERNAMDELLVGGMMACIAQPSLKAMTPAAVTMLSRIRAMETIEEVHAYVHEFMEGASEELKAMPQ